jgi:hypothetical protein
LRTDCNQQGAGKEDAKMTGYMSALRQEVARLRAKGGGWTDEQINSIARRNVAFARGVKSMVECVGLQTVAGGFRAVCRDPKTGKEVASGADDWHTRPLAEQQAREIAFARGLDPVQS